MADVLRVARSVLPAGHVQVARGTRPAVGGAGAADPVRAARNGISRVTLLGGFGLTVDGRPVSVPVTLQRVVALMALRGRCGRSRLAGSLWPENTEARALANLRTAIWRANQLCPGLVVADHDCLALDDDVDVDVTRLVRAAHDVMDGRATTDPDQPTLRYVEGDLLPDWSDEWLVPDRERLRQLRLHVLETMAGQLSADGMFGLAMEAALAALRADALRESAHRAVIRIHLAEGNLAEAVQAYRHCCAVLSREFGVAPSAETSRLVGSLGWAVPAVPIVPAVPTVPIVPTVPL